MLMRLRGVKRVWSKGRLYLYHRATGDRIKADPADHNAVVAEVVRLDARAAKQGTPDDASLGGLIRAYKESPEFQRLAPRTRADYERVFNYLQSLDGMPLIEIDTPFVLDVRDMAFRKHKRRFATYVVDVLALLFAWGKPRGKVAGNPARDVPKIQKARHERVVNRPWTRHEVDVVLDAAPAWLALPIALGAFTGMREGDCLSLPWSAWDGQGVDFRQGKTDDPLWVPAHSRLLPLILAAKARRKATVMVVGKRGLPYTGSGFRALFFRLIRRLEREKKIGTGLTFHGLRHTVATLLAETGCDNRTIMAITGHQSEQSVAGYTRKANMKRRAKAGIAKLEGRKKRKANGTMENSLENRAAVKNDAPASR